MTRSSSSSTETPSIFRCRSHKENVRDLSTELRTLAERAKRADVSSRSPYANFGMSPIVDRLQTTRSRIWWFPTAELSCAAPCTLLVRIARANGILLVFTSRPTPQPLTALVSCKGKRFVAASVKLKLPASHRLYYVGAELDNIRRRVDSRRREPRTRRSISRRRCSSSASVPSLGRCEPWTTARRTYGGRGGASGSYWALNATMASVDVPIPHVHLAA